MCQALLIMLLKGDSTMKLPKKITLCEVGLRDGLQNEKVILTTEQKVGLLKV